MRAQGRGFREEGGGGGSGAGGGGGWERLESGGGGGPARSMNGWVVICTGLHEESQHDDVYDAFADHGEVRTLHMNTDRQTGYVKGYALVEFDEKAEAQAAIDALDGTELLTKTIAVDWAFTKGPARGGRR